MKMVVNKKLRQEFYEERVKYYKSRNAKARFGKKFCERRMDDCLGKLEMLAWLSQIGQRR